MASYYPFLLAGVRIARGARARRRRLAARAGPSDGQRRREPPPRRSASDGIRRAAAPRLGSRPRLWLASFGATSLWYLIQNDAERALRGALAAARPVAPHLRAAGLRRALGAARARLGRRARLARTRSSGTPPRRSRASAGPCAAAEVAPLLRRRRRCDDRAPRHLLRRRLRVAPAASPRLTRAALSRPRAVVVIRRLEGGEGGNTARYNAFRPGLAYRSRAHGPSGCSARSRSSPGSSGRSSSPTG